MLTKAGLTCGDIKKIQNGEWSLGNAIINRQQLIYEEMARMLGSLELSNLMLRDNAQFETMTTDYYWQEIKFREQAGEAPARIAASSTPARIAEPSFEPRGWST